MKVLISAIIPVYNAEEYLRECIESLINQSLKEIEMIFINDGSNDNSLNILKSYEQIDNRIKIINQKNSGPSNARNNGLNLAQGEYISFIDSDDWIDLDMFKIMYDNAKKNNCDAVICDMNMVGSNSDIYVRGIKNNIKIFDRNLIEDIIFTSLLRDSQFNSMANKIFKREIIEKNNIRLDEKIFYAEDWLFNMEFFKFCNKASYINKCFYYYRRGHESSSSSYKEDTFEKVGLWIYRKRKEYAKIIGSNPYLAVYDLYKVTIHCIISEFRRIDINFKERIKRVKNILESSEVREVIRYISKSTMDVKEKYLLYCMKYRAYLGIIFYVSLGRLKEKRSCMAKEVNIESY